MDIENSKSLDEEVLGDKIDDSHFVDLLEMNKVVFCKQQTKAVQKQKSEAFQNIQNGLVLKQNHRFTEQQIKKKLDNFKTSLKRKLDDNGSFNENDDKLSPPQIKFLKLADAKKNPTYSKVPGKAIVYIFVRHFLF